MKRRATHREYVFGEQLCRVRTFAGRVEYIVDYREELLQVFEDLERRWRLDDAHLDREFGIRRTSILYALDLRAAIDSVRGNVPERTSRSAQSETDHHEQAIGNRKEGTRAAHERRWWQWWRSAGREKGAQASR
jgi:hypothetical protein